MFVLLDKSSHFVLNDGQILPPWRARGLMNSDAYYAAMEGYPVGTRLRATYSAGAHSCFDALLHAAQSGELDIDHATRARLCHLRDSQEQADGTVDIELRLGPGYDLVKMETTLGAALALTHLSTPPSTIDSSSRVVSHP